MTPSFDNSLVITPNHIVAITTWLPDIIRLFHTNKTQAGIQGPHVLTGELRKGMGFFSISTSSGELKSRSACVPPGVFSSILAGCLIDRRIKVVAIIPADC